MIARLRARFLQRTLREQVLVAALLLVGALIWVDRVTGVLQSTRNAWAATSSDLATQQAWLDNQPAIEERSAKAIASLDRKRTLDSTRLVAAVTAEAEKAGLTVDIDQPRSQRTAQFAFNTVRVTSRKGGLAPIISFYQALAARAPYLALDEFALQADRSGNGQLTATFEIAAVELMQ